MRVVYTRISSKKRVIYTRYHADIQLIELVLIIIVTIFVISIFVQMESFTQAEKEKLFKLLQEIADNLNFMKATAPLGLSMFDEKRLRIESATIGADVTLKKLGLIKDEISQREAYRVFGEAKVRSWRNQSLIKRTKVGGGNCKVTYSLIELETIKNLEDKRKIR